ncbi:hypothetical protein Cadr_000011714 [Camelus dromedarius]|uniref:Uncharacterized protein n=1 Tax=Camelus dromedarius TaxID=9838 RepID=A0A5N4DRB4_CAMDR|nr:hypothetical protein Cadr_000011714 [Camelus dromedarius]
MEGLLVGISGIYPGDKGHFCEEVVLVSGDIFISILQLRVKTSILGDGGDSR